MKLFQSATLKLTLWYLLILMAISITFSIFIYQISSNELGRGLPRTFDGREIFLSPSEFDALRQERISEASERLISNLVLLNIVTLGLGGAAGYFLARQTLSPIKEAMDEQGRFTSDASHELRTPLAVMRSEIEIALRNKNMTATQMKQLLHSNLEEVDKLRGLSDRLLQLTSDKQLEISSIPIDDVVTESINRVITLAQDKNISIESHVSRVQVQGNADSLADMLTIILDNAIKYSLAHTAVTISSEQQGKVLELEVRDQGRGIKASELPHIFGRFYRADLSRNKERVDGHGLGLAIAQRIAELHKTKITVTSTPGIGSIFSVKLPIVSSANPQQSTIS